MLDGSTLFPLFCFLISITLVTAGAKQRVSSHSSSLGTVWMREDVGMDGADMKEMIGKTVIFSSSDINSIDE